MSFFSKIRGTLEGVFQIGVGGPQIKRETATIAGRNAADTLYAIMRGAAPVGNDDLVTLDYFNTNNAAANGLTYVKIALTTSGLTTAGSLPANAKVMDVRLEVTTPYDNAATIAAQTTVGTVSILAAADSDPTAAAAVYQVPQVTDVGGSTDTVDVVITGVPTVGVSVIYIGYAIPSAL